MTGLKDIKPVATLGRNPLYSAEQMQEYAKAKVKELLFEQLWNDRFYANSKIFFDKEVEKICSTIFEEDTKND
ncbi:hypothetical protein ACI1TX_06950 [Lactococcus petauri]|uniref:hypothetical protein n=1 Tax=Lactococcus TaxID=1357 RepID=UPI0002E7DE32|nr:MULTISPECIES: hypothetical protein [Lactococcus]MDG6128690.1 hypothetical protein [Lactococcus formosensis]